MVRGIERRKIFHDDSDWDAFVERLDRMLPAPATPCCGWALMPNHVHLLLRTGQVPMATVMRRLLTGYAVTFNRRHRSHGKLFQNRYQSILCQQEPYLLEVVRYVHLNPLPKGDPAVQKQLLDRHIKRGQVRPCRGGRGRMHRWPCATSSVKAGDMIYLAGRLASAEEVAW